MTHRSIFDEIALHTYMQKLGLTVEEAQEAMTPAQAIDELKAGNARFLNKETKERDLLAQVNDTAGGQAPFAAVVSCIDSRIPTEIVFYS